MYSGNASRDWVPIGHCSRIYWLPCHISIRGTISSLSFWCTENNGADYFWDIFLNQICWKASPWLICVGLTWRKRITISHWNPLTLASKQNSRYVKNIQVFFILWSHEWFSYKQLGNSVLIDVFFVVVKSDISSVLMLIWFDLAVFIYSYGLFHIYKGNMFLKHSSKL